MFRPHLLAKFAPLLLAACASADNSAQFEALRTGAAQGDAGSQFSLAVAYDLGNGVPQDLEQAARWYEAAADQGHVDAMNSLGSLYQAGAGVSRDDEKAVALYRKASDQGHAGATNNLAYMYDEGLGVPEDDRRAIELYEAAAGLGEVKAMLNLGVLLASGAAGAEPDHVEAYKWLELARFYTQDSSDMQLKWRARGALDELEKLMTPGQIQQGQSRAKAWSEERRSS